MSRLIHTSKLLRINIVSNLMIKYSKRIYDVSKCDYNPLFLIDSLGVAIRIKTPTNLFLKINFPYNSLDSDSTWNKK